MTEGATGVPFNSLSLVGPPAKEGGKPLYKLLSAAEVPHAWLSLLFAGGWEVVAQRDWAAAYPRRAARLRPGAACPPLSLQPLPLGPLSLQGLGVAVLVSSGSAGCAVPPPPLPVLCPTSP